MGVYLTTQTKLKIKKLTKYPKSGWVQNISNMFTISIMPNMVGTRIEKIKGLLICMLLDSTYIVPMILSYP
jgi:hypothetical protein